MYGSLRFYIDKLPTENIPEQVLQLFALFSYVLGLSYDHISYLLFHPDADRPIVNQDFPYDAGGKKAFAEFGILPSVKGRDGTLSAPIIEACSDCGPGALYGKSRVQIQFPDTWNVMILRVDYPQRYAEKMTFAKYRAIVTGLCNSGFHVNNSFYHVYARKIEAASLDGVQIGSFLGFGGRRNIRAWLSHQKNHYTNHIMAVYCANSFPVKCIPPQTVDAIADIVGKDPIAVVEDTVLFSLPGLANLTGAYTLSSGLTIAKLTKLLDSAI